MTDVDDKLAGAVRTFWRTRKAQKAKQGRASGKRDRGGRSAVTGGAQMDGFVGLVTDVLLKSGLPDETIFHKRKGGGVVLPGFFRPAKEWDLLVVVNGYLLASIEFKSHVGPSFGNNYNNRTEEAIGSSHDLWTAYRDGAFGECPRPWLGYLMFLEEASGSTTPVRVQEPHFPVFEEFRGASYAQRYELLCRKLVRERLYDAACLILSDPQTGAEGKCREVSFDLSIANFCASLAARSTEYAKVCRVKEQNAQYRLS